MKRFGPTWEETATLGDGQTVELRLVKPSDELLLRRAFAEASDASVATRFLTHKPRLTDAEVLGCGFSQRNPEALPHSQTLARQVQRQRLISPLVQF